MKLIKKIQRSGVVIKPINWIEPDKRNINNIYGSSPLGDFYSINIVNGLFIIHRNQDELQMQTSIENAKSFCTEDYEIRIESFLTKIFKNDN